MCMWLYLVYPLPWNSVLLKLLITVCCKDEERGLFRSKKTSVSYLKLCVIDPTYLYIPTCLKSSEHEHKAEA